MQFLNLLWLNFLVHCRCFIEYLCVIYKYYFKNFSFFLVDTSLLLSYLFFSPYSIYKKFVAHKKVSHPPFWGETYLTTMEQIAKVCGITSQDKVIELGCGRGRNCFWLSYFIGCSVIGIDYVDTFVQKARRLQKRFCSKKDLLFRKEDILDTSFDDASVILFFSTSFDSLQVKKIFQNFASLPKGTKIITTSFPIKNSFKVTHKFSTYFLWGIGDVYVQVKV